MGAYKNEHGKSIIREILNKVAFSLPNLAGDVLDVLSSPNPIGTSFQKIKEKLAHSSTGQVGDNFFKQIDELSDDDLKLFELEVADKNSARDMYVNTGHDQADKIASNIMKLNLPYIIGLAFVNVIVIVLSNVLNLSAALILAIGNIIGMVIQSLIQERSQVVGFYMGSSLGSKLKDKAKSLFT